MESIHEHKLAPLTTLQKIENAKIRDTGRDVLRQPPRYTSHGNIIANCGQQ